ncbi:MAG TPA: DUF2911 domain-containing protein [Bryobacteraceae bacterium]|nr:DUF2911 domain-containing protein [Bryobacteraceae bacterium]
MTRFRLTRFRILALAGVLVVALAGVTVAVVRAQEFSRHTSPPAKASGVIGGDHITIDYYAPSMHGRKIMGGLVPYGEVWCTGANWATKITTENDLDVNGLKLPKGSYSIWTLPGEKEWKLIINKQTGQFHLDYDESQDFARVAMNLKKLSSPVETFRIEIASEGGNKGTLHLIWENTDAWVPVTVLR